MCHNNTYIDQSPAALNLTIVEGELDMSQFTCLKRMNREVAGLQVEATIIGASHVLSFSRDGAPVFHEILACVQPANDQVLRTWPLNELPATVESTFDGVLHSFSHEFFRWGSPAIRIADSLCAESKDTSDGQRGVYFEFPQGDLEHTPVTVVVVREDDVDKQFHIVTAHSYPGKGLVRSSTTLINTEV